MISSLITKNVILFDNNVIIFDNNRSLKPAEIKAFLKAPYVYVKKTLIFTQRPPPSGWGKGAPRWQAEAIALHPIHGTSAIAR